MNNPVGFTLLTFFLLAVKAVHFYYIFFRIIKRIPNKYFAFDAIASASLLHLNVSDVDARQTYAALTALLYVYNNCLLF